MPRVMIRASWLARAEARKEGSFWEPRAVLAVATARLEMTSEGKSIPLTTFRRESKADLDSSRVIAVMVGGFDDARSASTILLPMLPLAPTIARLLMGLDMLVARVCDGVVNGQRRLSGEVKVPCVEEE